jgi:hypothetical protein
MSKRVLGITVLILSVAGAIFCAAGMAGGWIARATVNERVDRVYTRVDSGLDRVEKTTDEVLEMLDKAAQSLREVKAAKPQASTEPEKNTSFRDGLPGKRHRI